MEQLTAEEFQAIIRMNGPLRTLTEIWEELAPGHQRRDGFSVFFTAEHESGILFHVRAGSAETWAGLICYDGKWFDVSNRIRTDVACWRLTDVLYSPVESQGYIDPALILGADACE